MARYQQKETATDKRLRELTERVIALEGVVCQLLDILEESNDALGQLKGLHKDEAD